MTDQPGRHRAQALVDKLDNYADAIERFNLKELATGLRELSESFAGEWVRLERVAKMCGEQADKRVAEVIALKAALAAAEATVAALTVDAKAANHWFKEANEEHNRAEKLAATVAAQQATITRLLSAANQLLTECADDRPPSLGSVDYLCREVARAEAALKDDPR